METAQPVDRAPLAYAPNSQKRPMLPLVLATILFYLLLLPEQFHPRVGGILVPAYRAYLIAMSLYFLTSGLKGWLRFTWVDLLVVGSAVWILLASYQTSGSIATGFIQFGAHFVDITLAYFMARVAIRSPRDLRIFLILIAPGIGVTAFIVLQEAVTHVRFLQPLASSMTGVPMRLPDDTRLGFLRGAASFPHPILAGIFLASLLPLYLASGIRGWPKVIGIISAAIAFFTMSSAALLGLVAGTSLWFFDWMVEKIENLKWRMLLFFSAIMYTAVELTSNTGFYALLVRYASLNTATAYNRVLIIRFGSENIARNPWFGIGYDDWDRPVWMYSGSFDHFWLIMALRFGIPVLVMLGLATFVGIVSTAVKSNKVPLQDRRLLRGVAISLAVFSLGALSVSLWLSVLVWFSMLLGIAVNFGRYQPDVVQNIQAPAATPTQNRSFQAPRHGQPVRPGQPITPAQ
ncbi:MAG: O-antigen ligase family protein [Alteraurantiacibacter sp.]